MRPLLEVRGLNVAAAGRPLLRDVSFSMRAGERVGLVGESGSGKSLTALALLQLLPAGLAASGQVSFDGAALEHMDEAQLQRLRGAGIGLVFQEPLSALDPLMNIGEQIAESLRVHHRLPRREIVQGVIGMLGRVGLTAQGVGAERYPHEISGGQRQRVALAMALAPRPRLLVADEPTTALDVHSQAGVLALMLRLVHEEGAALLLISHDLPMVAQHTERILVMQAGSLAEQADSARLLAQAEHPYTRELAAASRLPRLRTGAAHGPVTEPPLLAVQGLVCRHRGRRALDEVDLSVMPRESVGIVGESGAGKSTLLRAILGVEPVSAGRILLQGESLLEARGESLRRLRRAVQCVFQDPVSSFDPRWRIGDIVAEPLHLLESPLSPHLRRQRVTHWIESMGLSAGDVDRYPHQFSGGQRQRIALARALIVEPALVVLDEAVSALDAATRRQVLQLLADLSQTQDLAYLFVSHDLAALEALTDRVLVLEEGKVVDQGATAAVLARFRGSGRER